MATSGEEALALCGQGDIDLVLLDVCMPDMDGYEVCRRLKANPKTRNIVVIFVTVKGSRENIAQGYELGAADYITKPFNLPMVLVRVEAAMRVHREDIFAGSGEGLTDPIFTDPLTGLRNRVYLMQRFEEEVLKAKRYNYPIACIAFDVDEVRPIDDELGAVSLDDLLGELAMAVRNHSRTSDIVARYDNTVFVSVLPHCILGDAILYATKIMEEVNATIFADPSFPTTARLAVGIAAWQNGRMVSAEHILGEAMHSLLQAKSRPHNQRLVARDLTAA